MSEYNDLLKEQIGASVFGIALIIVLIAVLLLLNKRRFFDDLGKIGKPVVNIFVIAAILLGGVYFSFRIINLRKDIKDAAYITYNGDFEVSSFKGSYVTLIDESGELKLDGRLDLSGGKYSGTIVYAENSRYILELKEYKKTGGNS